MTLPTPSYHAIPAGFWMRSLAHGIDLIILMFVLIPPFIAFYGDDLMQAALEEQRTGVKADTTGIISIPVQIVLNIIPIVVVIFLWRWRSATPGKMLLKIGIVDQTTGGSPSVKQCVIRFLGYIPPLIPLTFAMLAFEKSSPMLGWIALLTVPLFLGFLSIAWHRNKQGWHDRWAKTLVVRTDLTPPPLNPDSRPTLV